jgi:hypothetical protein
MSTMVYPMHFKTATDRLTNCVTLREIAEEAGVSDASIRRARLDPASAAYRKPPSDWREVVARIARKRARAFDQLADELSRSGSREG